jgi:hypothetical protein
MLYKYHQSSYFTRFVPSRRSSAGECLLRKQEQCLAHLELRFTFEEGAWDRLTDFDRTFEQLQLFVTTPFRLENFAT